MENKIDKVDQSMAIVDMVRKVSENNMDEVLPATIYELTNYLVHTADPIAPEDLLVWLRAAIRKNGGFTTIIHVS